MSAALSAHPFAALARASYVSLMTFRASGEGVATPVWFAAIDHTLYLFTFPSAGKVKRLRRNPQVTIAPCTLNGKVTGPTIPAHARVVTDPAEAARAQAAQARKYGLIYRLYNGYYGLVRFLKRRPPQPSVWIAIEAGDLRRDPL